jgi:hypothetical protein
MRNPTRSDRPATPVPASDSPSADLKRRRFLLSLGAGGAGAAAVAAATLPGVAAAQPAVAAPTDQDAGYRETDHVRDYYRTAKL